MKDLNVYLFFSGHCQEALEHYKNCFGGEITLLQTFADLPAESIESVPEDYKSKIMHAEFKAENIFIMASDGMPGQPETKGNNIALSIYFTNEEEQKTAFDKLKEGGSVLMPLEKTFWGANFGRLVDKFGISWMMSCNPSAAENK